MLNETDIKDYKEMGFGQPPPAPSVRPDLWPKVISDMQRRNAMGTMKYGTPLRAFNGRDALQDAYEEALDLCAYLRQAIFERTGK